MSRVSVCESCKARIKHTDVSGLCDKCSNDLNKLKVQHKPKFACTLKCPNCGSLDYEEDEKTEECYECGYKQEYR